MDTKKILIMVACSGILAACSTQNFTEPGLNSKSDVQRNASNVKLKVPDIKPNSPLLAPVDKSIQESIIKRIQMDLNPDIEHLRNTAQIIRDDIPPINLSSLEFIPVVARPRALLTHQGDSILWIDKEFAYMYGKSEKGEDLYVQAKYKDKSSGMNPRAYQNVLEAMGKGKADSMNQKFLNRKDIDHWRIDIFSKGSIMFKLMDYARKQSDDGKFFILTQGKHHLEICYFKDGKAVSCRGGSRGEDIVVRDFASLMR